MKKVLIVDDAAFMRHSLRSIMDKTGIFEVIGEAGDGEAAIKKYQALNPDIVTMDITMPLMDGIQALKEIKKIDPSATVIMISAMGQESYVKEAIIAGAKGFIIKPWKEDVVISQLSKL